MIISTLSDDIRLLNITVGVAAKILRELITHTYDGTVIQIVITPASDITIKDIRVGDSIILAGGVSKVFPCGNMLDILQLSAAGNVVCALELYINK